MTNTAPSKRSRQLTEAEAKPLLDHLDKLDGDRPARCRRPATPRLRYRRTNIAVRITQPGGGSTDHVLTSRNLSAGGICLIHTAFLHTGTDCRVVLRRRLGGEETIPGSVTWCRHVVGTYHTFGVKFARTIFVKHFLEPDECGDLLSEGQVDPAELTGRVLMIDDQEMDRALFAHHLRQTKCEVVSAANVSEAAEQIMLQAPDVVVCDLNLGGKTGEQAVADFRAAGFKGFIAVLTAETDPARLKAAVAAGAGAILQKPYQPDNLIAHLAGWLKGGGAASDRIYSTMAGTPGADVLIGMYVTQVTGLADQLRAAVDADDLDKVRTLCQTLKGTGGGYGFGILSDAAKDAVTSLDASRSVAESKTELQLLQSVCRRLSASSPPEAAKPGKKAG